MALGTKMQPPYARPVIKQPEFTQPEEPCYDYRNMEGAGKYRGVGQAGKTASPKVDNALDAIPHSVVKSKVRRDHKG